NDLPHHPPTVPPEPTTHLGGHRGLVALPHRTKPAAHTHTPRTPSTHRSRRTRQRTPHRTPPHHRHVARRSLGLPRHPRRIPLRSRLGSQNALPRPPLRRKAGTRRRRTDAREGRHGRRPDDPVRRRAGRTGTDHGRARHAAHRTRRG